MKTVLCSLWGKPAALLWGHMRMWSPPAATQVSLWSHPTPWLQPCEGPWASGTQLRWTHVLRVLTHRSYEIANVSCLKLQVGKGGGGKRQHRCVQCFVYQWIPNTATVWNVSGICELSLKMISGFVPLTSAVTWVSDSIRTVVTSHRAKHPWRLWLLT